MLRKVTLCVPVFLSARLGGKSSVPRFNLRPFLRFGAATYKGQDLLDMEPEERSRAGLFMRCAQQTRQCAEHCDCCYTVLSGRAWISSNPGREGRILPQRRSFWV